MPVTEKIKYIISSRCLKQSAIARASGYTPRQFNDLLHGRKRFTADDVVPICKALSITPNELFSFGHTESTPSTAETTKAGTEKRQTP